MLQHSILLQFFDEILVGDCSFIPSFCTSSKVLEVFHKRLIIRDFRDNTLLLTFVVCNELDFCAHAEKSSESATRRCHLPTGCVFHFSVVFHTPDFLQLRKVQLDTILPHIRIPKAAYRPH